MLHPLTKHGAHKFYAAPSVRRAASTLRRPSTTDFSLRSRLRKPVEVGYHVPSGSSSFSAEGALQQGEGSNRRSSQDIEDGAGVEQLLGGVASRCAVHTPQTEDSDIARSIPSHDTRFLHQYVLKALQDGEVYDLLQAFLAASEDPEYLRVIPVTTVKEILRTLDPKNLLEPYIVAHRDLGEDSVSVNYRSKHVRPLRKVFAEYVDWMQVVLSRWRATGRTLGIAEYKMFLNIARSIGDGRTALTIFNTMREDKVEFDTTCYNYFFEARCWSNAYDPLEKYRLRVIPRYLAERQLGWTRRGFRGHKVGIGGLKEEILENFSTMIRSGLKPDATTYSMVIQAMGREGDIKGVNSVLHQVWDVDVEKVMSEEDSDTIFGNRIPLNSPLYPKQELLFTIAHTFGSNNQIPVALRIVDIFSRKYGLEIGFETWQQLFQWTFVLSSRRYGPHKTDGSSAGQLPLQSMQHIWNTMISEPYNIKPTMPMYNRYIKNMMRRQILDSVLELMRAGRELLKDRERSLTVLLEQELDAESPLIDGQTIARRRQELEIEKLLEYRDYAMLRRWFTMLLGGRRWISSDNERRLKWERIMIPDVLAEFRDYAPRNGWVYWKMTCGIQFRPVKGIRIPIQITQSGLAGIVVVQSTEACKDSPFWWRRRWPHPTIRRRAMGIMWPRRKIKTLGSPLHKTSLRTQH